VHSGLWHGQDSHKRTKLNIPDGSLLARTADFFFFFLLLDCETLPELNVAQMVLNIKKTLFCSDLFNAHHDSGSRL